MCRSHYYCVQEAKPYRRLDTDMSKEQRLTVKVIAPYYSAVRVAGARTPYPHKNDEPRRAAGFWVMGSAGRGVRGAQISNVTESLLTRGFRSSPRYHGKKLSVLYVI
jgi:hypothetical protein